MSELAPPILFVLAGAEERRSVSRALRASSHAVRFASGLDAALQALREQPGIAAVFVPRRTGDGCGFRCLEALRDQYPHVVRVLLTGTCDAAAVGAVDEDLVERFVAKPWGGAPLRRAVRLAAGSHARSRAARRDRIMLRRRERQLRALREAPGVSAVVVRELAEQAARWRDAATGLASLIAEAAGGGQTDASHAERSARRAVAIGRRLGMSAEEIDEVRLAALLHDVDRLASDARPDQCPIERARLAARLVAKLPFEPRVVAAVRHCRERWDGAGGPAGLRAGEIPRAARVLAVACAAERAGDADVATLVPAAGRLYDPEIIAALEKVLEVERAVERDLDEVARSAGVMAARESSPAVGTGELS